jgi:hypothetical protein
MSNININELIKQVIDLKHEEDPEIESVEFQAFVNGWNNSLQEVINYLKQKNGENN